MIEVRALTKTYGPTTAVRDLSFVVRPGVVTGFLGPNGSGKSTTMRVVLGLAHPTAGDALVHGVPYARLRAPLRHVGALLEARAAHPGRTARHHLTALARSNRIPSARVREVLELAGLAGAADRRAAGYSLGMAQRLGVAAALLGDPSVLLLDEPVNGLDTDGIRWVRALLRSLAAEGRTVLVSSHLMSEMELVADRLVVIGAGRLVAEGTVTEVIAAHSARTTRVRAPHRAALLTLLDRLDAQVVAQDDGSVVVTGPSPAVVGEAAHAAGVALHELVEVRSSLEDVYARLTDDVAQHRAARTDAEVTR